MNLPKIYSHEEQAIDIVVSVLNRAMHELGERQSLGKLATTRKLLQHQHLVDLNNLKSPLAVTSEKFIADIIENQWKLTDVLMYMLKNRGTSVDEVSQYLYFEAIFSQPTVAYPIPQATVSVFFRVRDKRTEPDDKKGVSELTFRIEGHSVDHDVRFVRLTPDWILGVIQMKIKLFKRIEGIRMF